MSEKTDISSQETADHTSFDKQTDPNSPQQESLDESSNDTFTDISENISVLSDQLDDSHDPAKDDQAQIQQPTDDKAKQSIPPPKYKLIHDQGDIQSLFNMARKAQSLQDNPLPVQQQDNESRDDGRQRLRAKNAKSVSFVDVFDNPDATAKQENEQTDTDTDGPESARGPGKALVGKLSIHSVPGDAAKATPMFKEIPARNEIQIRPKEHQRQARVTSLEAQKKAAGNNDKSQILYDSDGPNLTDEEITNQADTVNTSTGNAELALLLARNQNTANRESKRPETTKIGSKATVGKKDELKLISSSHSAFAAVPREQWVPDRSREGRIKFGKVQIPSWAQPGAVASSKSYTSSNMSDSGSSINDMEVKEIMFGSLESPVSSAEASLDDRLSEPTEVDEVVRVNRVRLPEWLKKADQDVGGEVTERTKEKKKDASMPLAEKGTIEKMKDPPKPLAEKVTKEIKSDAPKPLVEKVTIEKMKEPPKPLADKVTKERKNDAPKPLVEKVTIEKKKDLPKPQINKVSNANDLARKERIESSNFWAKKISSVDVTASVAVPVDIAATSKISEPVQDQDNSSYRFSEWRFEMSADEIVDIKQKSKGLEKTDLRGSQPKFMTSDKAASDESRKIPILDAHKIGQALLYKAFPSNSKENNATQLAVGAQYSRDPAYRGNDISVATGIGSAPPFLDKSLSESQQEPPQDASEFSSWRFEMSAEEIHDIKQRGNGLATDAASSGGEMRDNALEIEAKVPSIAASKAAGKVRIPEWLEAKVAKEEVSTQKSASEDGERVTHATMQDKLRQDGAKAVAISEKVANKSNERQPKNKKDEQVKPALDTKNSSKMSMFNQSPFMSSALKLASEGERKTFLPELPSRKSNEAGGPILNRREKAESDLQAYSCDARASSETIAIQDSHAQDSDEKFRVSEYVSKLNKIHVSPVKNHSTGDCSADSKTVVIKKLKSLDTSSLGDDLVSKTEEPKEETTSEDVKGSYPEVVRGSVAHLLGNYTGVTAPSSDQSRIADASLRREKVVPEQPKRNAQDNIGKTFIVGYALQGQVIYQNFLSQIKNSSNARAKLAAEDETMKSNGILKASAHKSIISAQDWIYRDDGYSSPRNDEQYSLASSSASDDYKHSLDSSFVDANAQTMASQKSYPTIVGNVAISAKGNGIPGLMMMPGMEEDSPQQRQDIHNKLEEMLQRRLHGPPGVIKGLASQRNPNAKLDAPHSMRPKEVTEQSFRAVAFQGVAESLGESSLPNGFQGSSGQQTNASNGNGLHNGLEKDETWSHKPTIKISHKYSESAKMKKQRLLQELSSSFKTNDIDEGHYSNEEITLSYKEEDIDSDSAEKSLDSWKKFKRNTLRDAHADNDTRPINKDNVVRMLTDHLGGEPTVETGKSERREANGIGSKTFLMSERSSKRALANDMFKLTSDDIRSDTGDGRTDEDEEVTQALSNGRLISRPGDGAGYGIPLASSSPTTHRLPPQVKGTNVVNRQHFIDDDRALNTDSSTKNKSSRADYSTKPDPREQTSAERKQHVEQQLQFFNPKSIQGALSTIDAYEKDFNKSSDLRPIERHEKRNTTVAFSMATRSPTGPSVLDSTEYYDPKHNDESVIKPSQFKRHNFGSSISRPIHIHQNIPGAEPPAYVPQGFPSQNVENRKVQDSVVPASSEHAHYDNNQAFSDLMGANHSTFLRTQNATSIVDANASYHYKNVIKDETLETLMLPEDAKKNGKEKWYNSWRNRKPRKDKDYMGDSESVLSSKSGSGSRSSTPRSASPMLTLFKSLSSKFSPNVTRRDDKLDHAKEDRYEEGGMFLPEDMDEVQRRIRMNGIVRVNGENDIPMHSSNEIDDIASGEFVSARDWLKKQREGFDFRCVKLEIQNEASTFKNDNDARNMPLIKQAIVPGPTTPKRRKSKPSMKKENIGKVVVPVAFAGSDTLSMRNELLATDFKSKSTSIPNNLNVLHMEVQDEKLETTGFVANGYGRHHEKSRSMQRSESLNNVRADRSHKVSQINGVANGFKNL